MAIVRETDAKTPETDVTVILVARVGHFFFFFFAMSI